ncbi:FtsW/RodA/SpoVE family cell cycle protein [Bifidobacterium sp. UBA6881]|uniref:FtsW/RodA/SpoVE family cell cycle protein n=1 Tax=Bifidobacterium sp. UBA6881 TaxID=1946109 RepID=UPI0025BE6A9F|nr:putative peptidoglycan glycosyltransferase FtsW [Bifidobacterium sp. UBA6881]
MGSIKPGRGILSMRDSDRSGIGGTPDDTATKSSDIDDFHDFVGLRSLLNPLWCYHGFRLAVVILTVFGVIMVFSSSSVNMIANGQSPWSQALKQGLFCAGGIVVAAMAMAIPSRAYRKCSGAFLVFALVLQFMTLTSLGVEVNGNKGWIGIPNVFTVQPAEIVKLALCIWMPGELIDAREKVRKGAKPLELLRAYDRLLVGYLASLILIVAGKDLGTAMIVVAIGCIALLLGDFPVKALLASVAVCVAGVIVLVIVSPNRVQRIMAVYQECSASDLEGVCYQAIHGKYAIASGGLLGVGIGNSGEKWGYLPEAHNDFIFAIIGEETGFVGAALVILLFFVLGWSMMVIALKTYDRYISIVLICIAVWIVGQAFVNIGVVVGIFPVVGVPMPFVSAGGSSLIMCLGAAGVAISMMKEQPQIKVEARRV